MPSEDTQFKPGAEWRGNTKGRPPTKTLKEYVRQKLAEMTVEQREEFLSRIDPELQWQMGEGRPHQGIGQAEELAKLTFNIINYDGQNDNNPVQLPAENIPIAPADSQSEVQDSGVAQESGEVKDSPQPADNQSPNQ